MFSKRQEIFQVIDGLFNKPHMIVVSGAVLASIANLAVPVPSIARDASTAAAAFAKYIPRGWRIEERKSGDLNGDKEPDVVLKISLMSGEQDLKRKVIVLFRQKDGTYKQAFDYKARTSEDSGTFAEPQGSNVTLEIARGVLNINEVWGSRELEKDTNRFRWNASTQKFDLIGEDKSLYDRMTGKEEVWSLNLLTGKGIVEHTHSDSNGNTIKDGTQTFNNVNEFRRKRQQSFESF